MPLPGLLTRANLRLPLIAAPMFLVSGVDLVTATCRSGVVGTFPALNARNDDILDDWLKDITQKLQAKAPTAPYGVNLIVHKSNPRLQQNLEKIVKYQVPIVITSLGAAREVIDAVHSYGGVVFHDVTNVVHAKKAAAAGVDGLILVCSGAGGHAGAASAFALLPAVRKFFDKTIILAGALSTGESILAAQALGADLAYMGTRFMATKESTADQRLKDMIRTEQSGPPPFFLPTVYTDKISGIYANFLRKSLTDCGLDPDNIYGEGLGTEDHLFEGEPKPKEKRPWADIWSAGHGVMNVDDIPTVQELVDRLDLEYQGAKETLSKRNLGLGKL